MKKKRSLNIIIAIFIAAGIMILLYPFLGFWLSDRSQSYAVQEYDDRYAQMQEQERQEQWDKAVSYNEQLQPGAIEDPFSESPLGSGDDYQEILNIGNNGMMGYLQIPKINLRLPVYHGTTEEALEAGAGHLEGTHLPVGGAGTHAVLTGHTGLRSSVLFTNLTKLEENDEFYIHIMGEVLAYRIDRIKVVLPTETEDLQAIEGEDYITLITCTPYGVNSHRLLVRGKRVPYTQEEIQEKIADTGRVMDWMTAVLIGAIALFVIILVVIIVKYRKHKKLYTFLMIGIFQLMITMGTFKSVSYAYFQGQGDETQSEDEKEENFRFVTVEAEKGIFIDDTCIYEEMDTESRIVGKAYQDGTCYVLKRIDQWFFIESGDVRGFVKKDGLYVKEDAQKRMEELVSQSGERIELVVKMNEEGEMDEVIYDESGSIPMRLANTCISPEENTALAYVKITTKDTVIEKEYLKAEKEINIVEKKEESARVVGVLPQGGQAYLIQEEEDWYYIESGDVRGFVKAKDISGGFNDSGQKRDEAVFFEAKRKVDTKDNSALYYTMTSVKEGDPLEAVREALATYAQQFTGSVYAGEETNSGTGSDDGNFVKEMYGEYGYNIPADSVEQMQYGTRIPYENVKSGDLVFFTEGSSTGQAAIYIGSGKIVYAEEHSKKIKVNDIDIQTITAVVDIISGKGEETENSEQTEKGEQTENSEQTESSEEYLGNFKLTAYCNCELCCEEWANGYTASGNMPVEGKTVAMGGLDLGTQLLIGNTVYVLEDRGTPYGHIDIFMDSHQECLEFGVQYADVYLIR